MHRVTSRVAAQVLAVASVLPTAWGCNSDGAISSFSPSSVTEADGAVLYDPPPLWSGGAPILLGTSEDAVSLALDSTTVYWQSSGGSVLACPLDGCPGAKPTLLSTLVGPPPPKVLETLTAANGIAVFVSASGADLSSFTGSHAGPSPSTYRTTAGGGLGALVSDDSHVYFVDSVSMVDGGYSLTETLYACPLGASCTSPQKLYVSANPYYPYNDLGPLFVADPELYFVDGSTLKAVSIHGGSARTVCASDFLDSVQALNVAHGYAYFTTSAEPTSVYECPVSGGTDPSVYIQDLQPYALANDGTSLYWTNYVDGPGTVVTCLLGATCDEPRTVASSQDQPFAIAANATSVFWTTSTSVYRADK